MSIEFKPHSYQTDIKEFIFRTPRCAVFAAMGTGKSVTTLSALDALSMVDDVYPVLIIAPLRVAKSTWPDEVAKWAFTKGLRIVPIVGNAKERLVALNKPAELYTTNFENIPWLIEHYGDKWPFATLVVDELTHLKSFRTRQGSKRAKALAKVAHTKVKRFIGLTGTPSPNGLSDLWGQMWFVDRGERLGSSFSAFEGRWFTKGYDGYSIKPLPHAQREIEERLKDVCITVKGLPVDQPIENVIYVDLPSAARKVYDEMEKEMFAEIEEIGVEALNAAAKTIKCQQIAAGALITDETGKWTQIHDEKLEALHSVVEEAAGAPVLVAYKFKADLARLKSAFPKGRELDANPTTIKQWNEGRIPLLFAHPACLSAETEVLTENRGWVRIVDVQANERVFDGVEFVTHSGCSFSGVRPVIERFGITLTPNHKLLIQNEWVEAKNVRDCARTRAKARYTYCGAEDGLRSMFDVRRATGDVASEHDQSQQGGQNSVPVLHKKFGTQHEQNSVLRHMERYGRSGNRSEGPQLRSLWCSWTRDLRPLVKFQELLCRHVFELFRQPYDRSNRQLERLLTRELSMVDDSGSAIEQRQQPPRKVSRERNASGRILSVGWRKSRSSYATPKLGDVRRASARGLQKLRLQEEPKVAKVYDLVDCGPRNRFLIRNADGEVFVSHNSAGHGLNLAQGGNILTFFNVDWSLETHMQIIERVGPMRQKQASLDRPVFIHYILARKTVDEMILERLRTKKTVQETLLEAMRRRKKG